MNKLTHLSLFSGVGGLDLAAEWAGFQTVGQCEWADYPRGVLQKHWPDVPKWRDIRTLTKEGFRERTELDTVTVLSGGFPCQPFSTAGKRRGKEDDRYLWPEMLRVISEIRPTWGVGENVAGLVSLALDTVLSDLEGIGYACQTLIIPACAVDAPHRRDRCAIVGYDTHRIYGPQAIATVCGGENPDSSGVCEVVPNTNSIRLQESGVQGFSEESARAAADNNRWLTEPDVGRVAHGIPHRVDRLRCLGNAVVPQQFYPVFRAIADIERSLYENK